MIMIRRVSRFVEGTLPGLLLLAIVLMVSVDVAMRYIFNTPIRATSELAMIAVAWVVMLGCARAARKFQHITISVLSDAVRGRWREIHSLIVIVLTIAIMGYVVWTGIPYIMQTAGRFFPLTELPRWIMTASIPIGFLLMIVHQLQDAAQIVRDLRHGTSSYRFRRQRELALILDPTTADTTAVKVAER